MTEVLIGLLPLVPALSIGVSGRAMLSTPSRWSGVLLCAAAIGLGTSVILRLSDQPTAANMLLMGAVFLPGASAVLAYPRPRLDHSVEFCLWVAVLGAGVLATVLVRDVGARGTAGTFATVSVLALIGHGWFVLETGNEADREAMLWLALAALTAGSLAGLLTVLYQAQGAALGAIPSAAIGPAMAIGVRRPRLVDVRSLVVEAVVIAVVALSYLSLFVGVAAAFEAFGIDEPSRTVFAFTVLALAFGVYLLRLVLRGLIDEIFFGDRPNPLEAASAVTSQMADDPVLALRAIREALVLPYASISIGDIELAASGTAVTDTRRLPLLSGDDTLGEIVVGIRPGEFRLSADDEQVLRIVGPLIAQTLRAPVWRATSKIHGRKPSRRSKKNVVGCVATCTTDSVRPCRASHTPPRLLGTPCHRTRSRLTPCSKDFVPTLPERSPRSDDWCTTCVPGARRARARGSSATTSRCASYPLRAPDDRRRAHGRPACASRIG